MRLAGGVAGTVVHEDDLVVQPGERRREFPLEDGHVFLLVIEGMTTERAGAGVMDTAKERKPGGHTEKGVGLFSGGANRGADRYRSSPR